MVDQKSFLDTANGAIKERCDLVLAQIFDNIMDLNTRAEKTRKLTLTVEFLPSSARTGISYEVSVKPTLEPISPLGGSLCVTADDNGEPVMVEMVPQIPGPQVMGREEQPEASIIKLPKMA